MKFRLLHSFFPGKILLVNPVLLDYIIAVLGFYFSFCVSYVHVQGREWKFDVIQVMNMNIVVEKGKKEAKCSN